MTPAFSRGIRKALRTLAQMVVSGALTAAVNELAAGLSAEAKLLVGAGWLFIITFSHNYLETVGKIPVLLPSPGLVVATGKTEAVVEADVDPEGEVEGTLTDLKGGVVGEVVGQLGYSEKKE